MLGLLHGMVALLHWLGVWYEIAIECVSSSMHFQLVGYVFQLVLVFCAGSVDFSGW